MSNTLTPIDIKNYPDMLRLAEEVQATKKPRILKRENETIAVLMPVGTAIKQRTTQKKTKADYKAFRTAAGSWKDVDADTLLKNIYEDRHRANTRPPVKL